MTACTPPAPAGAAFAGMMADVEGMTDPEARAAPADAAEDQARCSALLQELQAAVRQPDAQGQERCGAIQALLLGWPADHASAQRVECLLALVQHHHLAARAAEGLAPAQAAADIARALGDAAVQRKALTYLGVMHMETGHFPAAIEAYAGALAQARASGDPAAEAPVWSNLGLALRNVAQYEEAMRCFERAAVLAQGAPAFGLVERAAWSNIATCALHLHDLRRGLAAARRAIELNPQPASAAECTSRAIAESNCARLLLEAGEPEAAARHAALAAGFGARFPSPRGEMLAAMTQGLVDLHRGDAGQGLPRLRRGLDLARLHVRSEVHDMLTACIAGYEMAGQPDVALVCLHELQAMNEQARTSQVVAQHRRHIARLDAGGLSTASAAAGIGSVLAARRDRLRDQLPEHELTRNRVALLEQQSVAAELHDDATGEHCYRVGRLASLLAQRIGLEDEVCFLIDLAARLHDIGKLTVPDAILLKPGRLTPGERAIMETHTTAGAEILARSDVPQMHVAEEIARHHHERWDGSGYPARLAGSAIPIAARVSALADVFDALTHARPYKLAWPVHEALAEIRRLRAVQFDPDLTDVFLELVPQLQREVGDLDAHLAAEARHSPFIQARRQIAEALKGADPAATLFELRR